MKYLVMDDSFLQGILSPGMKGGCTYALSNLLTVWVEAIQRSGALKGGALAVWRILRCNPFSKGGYNPVLEES